LLYRYGRAIEPVSYTTVLDNKDFTRSILGKGWSDIEGDFVWSKAPVAEIDLPADPKRSSRLRLALGSYIPDKSFRQHIDVFVNGKPAGGWDFDNFEMRRQIEVDLGPDPGATQHIELHIAHPVEPQQYGLPDTRPLGVSLYGIK
ncbi:MAG TPA: hypothetical protein VF793_12195, partial [Telluria sp.]